jgi:hypothetical protein
MSYYFRPPNSREQNLFIVRTSIDDLKFTNFTNGTLNSTAYTSPSNVFLPPGFFTSYNNTGNNLNKTIFTMDYTNAKYEIPPTINIQIKNNIKNTSQAYYTTIVSVSTTQVQFYIYSLALISGNITPVYPLIDSVNNSLSGIGIQIQIIGRTLTGPTFAIANQGWTYVESTNPANDTIYTAMPVGTNGVVPTYDFTIGGSYGYLGGAGNGGIPNTSALNNYTPTEMMANVSNYYFFPIALAGINDSINLPVPTKYGQEIVIVLNQNPNNLILTIGTTNTTLTSSVILQTEGDTIKFISLNKDGVGIRWVKITNK